MEEILKDVPDLFSRFSIVDVDMVIKMHGDGRAHDVNFDPSKVRGFLVLNFVSGQGYALINSSQVNLYMVVKVPLLPSYHKHIYTHTFTARDVLHQWKPGGIGNINNQWIFTDWVTPDWFRVRYSLRISVPGAAVLAFTIDHQLLINNKTGQVIFEGDKFPSTGTYQYLPNKPVIIMHKQVENKLANLADAQNFSYDKPFNVQPNCSNTPVITPPTSADLDNGVYTIRLANGKALDADASQVNSNGGKVAIWDYAAGAPEQQWILTAINGKYTIRVKASNKALDLNASNPNYGAAITLWEFHGGANQQWIISLAGNGLYKIHSALPPNRVLDVSGGAISTNGTKIHLWDFLNGVNQLWKIEKVAPPPSPVSVGKIIAGQHLKPNDILKSPNGVNQLIYQGDGNLVIYRSGNPVWHSHTNGQSAGYCIMQGDGNLVIYNASNQAVWATMTVGVCKADFLAMQDDGNLVLYTAAGKPVWNTVTGGGSTNMGSATGQKLC
jgi:hypothetical protein